MNIGLYIRLSKEDEQNIESKSITSQKLYLNNYINKFDYQNKYEYIDDGYSGTNFDRPAFKKLILDIENKKIDTIITKDSSRLGRNITWVSYYLEEYFPSKNIRFIAIDDNYDSKDNNVDTDLLTFKNVFNDYYCKDISKKIRSSLKIKKIEGKFTGWKAPYGYIRNKEDYHKLEIDKKVYKNIKLIFNLACNNYNPSQIANYLNTKNIDSPLKYINKKNSKWTSKTIKDILINPTYIGNLTQGKRKKINHKLKKSINIPYEEWIIIENTHKAIIDKDIFYKVQDKIKNNSKRINKDNIKELIYCKECNTKIGINKRKNKLYLVCNTYKKFSKEKRCTPHTFNYLKIKNMIISEINKDINIKDDNLYSSLINKIYISENGLIEIYLNYHL